MEKGHYKDKNLIANLPYAFSHHKVIYSENSKPVDYIFLKVNKKFEEIIGIKKEKILGKKITNLSDNISNDLFTQIHFFGEIALRKERKSIEKYFGSMDRWYKIEVYSKEKGYFTTVFYDITEKKKLEEKLKSSRERYHTIFKSAPVGMIIEDEKGDIIKANKKICKDMGYHKKELVGSNIIDKFVLPKYEKLAKENIKSIINGENLEYDIETPTKDGEMKYYHLKETNINLPTGKKGILSMHIDVTDRKKTIKQLNLQLNFQKMLADISSKLVRINTANYDQKINNSLKKIGQFFKFDRSYIFQLSDDKKYISNTHEWTKKGIKSQIGNSQNFSVEKISWLMDKLYKQQLINILDINELGKKAKNEKEILKNRDIKSIVIKPIFVKNKLWGFFGFDSVKEQKKFDKEKIEKLKIIIDTITNAFLRYSQFKRIKNLTYRDTLTNLYNRRFFEAEMERLETKRQLPLSIIMGDLNGLKIINDSYGHEKGDQMLIETAKMLKEEIRKEDILARHGGDEFTILLPQTSNKEAQKIVKRINKKDREIGEDNISISIGIGVATKNKENEDIKEILKEADNNMYKNKLAKSRSTKNKIVENLINTLGAKSSETKEHAMRMTKLAYELGDKIGFSNPEIKKLSLLATLHDIGKTTISEEILKKPGKLTKEEWELIKEHPQRGYKIASASEEFAIIADEILYHHENWNGSGYPNGLEGKDIPYLARIISIIDAYDVMTNDRPYSKAISEDKALTEIKECAGSQFDPKLAEKFIELKENVK